MEELLKEATHRQRVEIAKLLHGPLAQLSALCVPVWGNRQRLNEVLTAGFPGIPHCACLYALDPSGIQVSNTVGPHGLEMGDFRRDRSARPYLQEHMPEWGFLLSDAYVDPVSGHPSLTGLHRIGSVGQLLGYLVANFDLRDLPITGGLYQESQNWRQIKGDPSIRGLLFHQTRTESAMDRSIDQSLPILEELLTGHGVFQCVIYFSSSRAIVWTIEDPFRYRVLGPEALTDPDVCLVFPRRPYPPDALIPANRVMPVLRTLQDLRFLDETLYLRSASINLFNGMLSLTFSCDGSHFMRYDEFLDKSLAFWVSEGNPNPYL